MPTATKLNWTMQPKLTLPYAVDAQLRGRTLTDAVLNGKVQRTAEGLRAALETDFGTCERFLDHFVPLSARIDTIRERLRVTLTRLAGRGRADFLLDRYCNHVDKLHESCFGELERLAKERPMRHDELAMQWQMHGTPLLANFARWSEPGLLVEQADVFVVHPVGGGRSQPFPLHNLLCVEGEYDNQAQPPEVVRLLWQVSLLNTDMPRVADLFPNLHRSIHVSSVAHLPVILAAAQDMDLAPCDRPTFERALASWLGHLPNLVTVAEQVWDWWEVYRDTRPAWPVALKSLDRLV